MKVLVVGTSNSVLRGGWVDGLKETVSGKVINRSVGASCSAFLLYELCSLSSRMEEYDIVIIDSMVNDEYFLNKGFLQEKYLLDYVQQIYTILAEKIVIYLSFSSQQFFNCQSRAELIHRAQAFSTGAYFISVKQILHNFLNDNKSIKQSLIYEDPGHVHRAIAKEIGRGIGKIINSTILSKTANLTASSRFSIYIPGERGCRLVIEETKIRIELLFEYLDKSLIRLPKYKIIHGLFVNAKKTNCCVEFYPDKNSYNIAKGYFGNYDGKMQMKFLHFKRPFLPFRNYLKVFKNVENNKISENFIHSKNALESDDCLIQLAGILVSSSDINSVLLKNAGNLVTNNSSVRETKMIEQNIDLESVFRAEEIKKTFPRSWIEL